MKRLDLFQILSGLLLIGAFPATVLASDPAAVCGAVELPYQIDGTYEGQWLGYCVAGVGDVNGDGKADFIVAAPAESGGGDGHGAYVYSGADGAIIFQFPGDFIAVAGAGDVNEDGTPDFVCGSDNDGSAWVFSGVDGSLIHHIMGPGFWGWSVAGGEDINGDRKTDIIVGGGNCARVLSGADGTLLYNISGGPGEQMGYSVALLGDLNGDGKSEFGAGARWTDVNGYTKAGSAFVYSGSDGTLIYRKDGFDDYDNFGWSMANAGDVNNDGKPDFVVGAVTADPGGLSAAGAAYVYSGADGSLIRRLDGFSSGDHFAFSVAGAGDINGDSFADVIVGAPDVTSLPIPSQGAAYVFSGQDGSLLYQMGGTEGIESVGWSVAGLGDADGDGKGDFLVSTPAANQITGWVRVFKSGSMFADINSDGKFSPTDVVSLVRAVYTNAPLSCPGCAADVNCDGFLTSSDVVVEVNAIFLGAPVFCVL